MNTNDIDINIFADSSLGKCLSTLSELLSQNPWLGYGEELDALADNYKLMKEYMRSGFDDNMRSSMYADMLLKAKRMVANAKLKSLVRQGGVLAEAYKKTIDFDRSAADIKTHLESFVQDIAMASIAIDGNSDESTKGVYERHQTYLDKAFCSILTNGSMTKAQAQEMADVILSPTIDNQDAQLLVSAFTLSSLFIPDINKVGMLIQIYTNAIDENVKQRALVGWVFASIECRLYADEVNALVCDILKQSEVATEVLEMAIQLVLCNNAEKDNEYLERNVFPEIMKNRNIDITKKGFVEKEDDTLEDILHPDATDKKIDELEASMRKMVEMQKSGADIYFGGFKQMKRFAFFYTLSNWFVPFNICHPAFSSLSQEMKDSPLLKMMFASNSFCDSDKYSLVLSMMSIFSKLPANIKEAVPAEMANATFDGTSRTAADIRRSYLQDLYRFFKVYPQRGFIDDFFARYPIILGERPFLSKLPNETRSMVKYLVKRKENALPLMLTIYDDSNMSDKMLLAYIYMKKGDFAKALSYYRSVYDADNTNIKALKGAALSAFRLADYDTAFCLYSSLVEQHGETGLRHQIYYALSLISVGLVDKAVSNLFRLSFEFDNNVDVIRALALGLALQGKTEQAINSYNQLISLSANTRDDNSALGYCYAKQGDWTNAVNAFSASVADQTLEAFYHDYVAVDKLSLWGINRIDIDILTDIANDFNNK